ncbi:MAG: hypothetical protein AB7J13_14115 [Pyrinomonadaceae bacterium]
MSDLESNPRSFLIMGGLALVTSIAVVSVLFRWWDLGVIARLILALIPVAAYIIFLIGYLRLIRMTDELQRKIHLEALAIAFPSSAVVIFSFEYLRKAGFITEFKPDYALIVMVIFWGIGFLIAWKRYQ